MNFLPYDYFVIETSMNIEQAVSTLDKALFRKKNMEFFQGSDENFMGTVSSEGFKIRRYMLNSRSPALPNIYGKFESLPNGLRIHVKIANYTLMIGFIIVWLVGLGYGLWQLIDHNSINPDLRGIIILSLIVYLIFWFSFLNEVGRGIKFLENNFLPKK